MAELGIYSFFLLLSSSLSCEIYKVEVRETSTTALLTWKTQSCDSVDSYTVSLRHDRWLACLDNQADSSNETGRREWNNIFQTSLNMTRLHPYSAYSGRISALKRRQAVKEVNFEFSTAMDVPDTKPVFTEKDVTERYTQSLKFFWEDPDPTKTCPNQNGRKDGYWLELRGLDPWTLDPPVLNNISVRGNEFFAGGLQPFTKYMLRVYSQNLGDLVNRNLYMELQARTGSRAAAAPVNVTAKTISESTVFLSWVPAYPPTGLIEKYMVRGGIYSKVASGQNWTIPISVNLEHHNDACVDQNLRAAGYVCYVVNQLQPGTQYIFQLQTINKGESGSTWSVGGVAETLRQEVSTEMMVDTPTSPNNSYNGDTGSGTTIAVLVMVGAVIVLTVVAVYFIYKLKLSRLKERLLLEQSISLSRLESTYSPDSITSQETDYTSIQTRRLPEPPPEKGAGAHPPVQQHLYQTPLPPGYLDMSGSSRRTSTASRPERRSRQSEWGQGEEEEGEGDVYLKPTFPRHNQDSGSEFAREPSSSIQPHSYGQTTTGAVGHQDLTVPVAGGSSPSSRTSSSHSHNPLLISQSINV